MKMQRALLLSTIGLLVALSLVVGCAPQRKVLPDSEGTPAGESQTEPGDESAPGMSDLQKTAQANSATATAAAAAEGSDAAGVTPTEPPPTEPPDPTTLPTPGEPTADAAATVAPTEPAPTATTQPSTGTGEETTYVVQRGDTLFSIARRYGTTVEAVAARNGIANPSLISVGQKLIIPASGTSAPSAGEQTYVVKRGDNLFRIALRYNMSYIDLARHNGIADPSRIYVGQVIRIPPR